MNSGILIAAVSLVLGLAAPLANAQSAEGQARTIQGYATGCSLYIFGGTPVLKLNLYLTAADAIASKTSVIKPQTDVVLDGAAGYTVVKLNKESQVRQICAAVMAQNAEKPVVVHTNAKNVVESVDAYGLTVKSDSYMLMGDADQKRIDSVVKAYIAKDWELEELRTKNAKPAAQ